MINPKKEASPICKEKAVKIVDSIFSETPVRGGYRYETPFSNMVKRLFDKAVAKLKPTAKAKQQAAKLKKLHSEFEALRAEMKKGEWSPSGYDGTGPLGYNTDCASARAMNQKIILQTQETYRGLLKEIYSCGTVEEVDGVIARAYTHKV